MNLLQSLLYRAEALPAGELEYLSWLAYFAGVARARAGALTK